ncbi:MAG: hypothetical protein EOO13_19825 [Chitinophagaceae bacterium]|nr:MAG: hypothetical protein EOO13_19825 [Chitinophagaceae bacterium]
MIEFEKVILDKMLAYREKTASCAAERGDLQNVKAYKDHVLQIEELLTGTINRFKAIEQNNTNKNNQE